MLERAVIQGKPATVAYLTSDFQPATPDRYDFIKVIFDDGDVMFAYPTGGSDAAQEGQEQGSDLGEHR